MKLYRFLRKEDIYSTFEYGCLRIGTAEEMRALDDDGLGRSDKFELTSSATPKGGRETITKGNKAYPPIFINGKAVYPETEISAGSVSVLSNAFLFCTSTIFDDEICKKMHEHFGYDAAFEISNIQGFKDAISKSPLLSGYGLKHGKVSYINRNPLRNLNEMTPVSLFEKRPSYQWQNEYRFVWQCSIFEEKGFLTYISDIRPFIKRVL